MCPRCQEEGRGADADSELAVILVLALRPQGAVGACQVLKKGVGEFAVECSLSYMNTWGVADAILKFDQEPATTGLLKGHCMLTPLNDM